MIPGWWVHGLHPFVPFTAMATLLLHAWSYVRLLIKVCATLVDIIVYSLNYYHVHDTPLLEWAQCSSSPKDIIRISNFRSSRWRLFVCLSVCVVMLRPSCKFYYHHPPSLTVHNSLLFMIDSCNFCSKSTKSSSSATCIRIWQLWLS